MGVDPWIIAAGMFWHQFSLSMVNQCYCESSGATEQYLQPDSNGGVAVNIRLPVHSQFLYTHIGL